VSAAAALAEPPDPEPPKKSGASCASAIRPPCYPKQEEAIFDPVKDKDGNPARYSFIEASTKAGKTRGCIAWLVEQAVLTGRRRAQLLVGGAGLRAGQDRLPPHQAGAAQGRPARASSNDGDLEAAVVNGAGDGGSSRARSPTTSTARTSTPR
jgi:hypothetical protein